MSLPRPTQRLCFGEFGFEPVTNELSGPSGTQRLPLKQADLLLRLIRHAGQPVRRETLIDEVWERKFVNEEVLSRAVADLRAALGDDAKAPRYIETLPKIGYRFVAPVQPSATSAAPTGTACVPATLVLPRKRRWRAAAALAAFVTSMLLLGWLAQRPPAAQAPWLTPTRLLHVRPFTAQAGLELFPRFTPDARWIVYTRLVPGDRTPAHLRLRAVDGTDDLALVQDEYGNYCGALSPDGTQLAWLRDRDARCEVMLRDLRGGPARALAPCGTGPAMGCPDFTRDGRELLLEGDDQLRGLRAVRLADGRVRPFETPPLGATDFAPRMSRDGQTIVFWRGDGNTRQAMRVASSGGTAVPLPGNGYLAFGHAFDLDDTPVSADDRFGQRGLVRLSAAPELLGGNGARFPDIAPNGALVYEVAHYDANLWRIDLHEPTLAPEQLTHTARYDSQPALSPDGQWLAFGSNREGREGVYLMRNDGRQERKLPLDAGQRWTSPAWSDDGTELVMLRYTDDGTSVCRHVLASGFTECTARLVRNRSGAFYLAAGRFAAVDEAPRAPGLWQQAFDGKPESRIDTGGAVDRCHATARWLACHRPGTAGLWLQDRTTHRAATILPELDAGLRAWDLTDDAVWFPRGGTARGLYRHDLASGTTVKVHDLVPTAIGDALSVAPDGSFAVLARTDALDVDLMYLPALDGSGSHRRQSAP